MLFCHEVMLDGVLACAQGKESTTRDLVNLRSDICSTNDLRKPANLEKQLLAHRSMDQEVAGAMTEMLQVIRGP